MTDHEHLFRIHGKRLVCACGAERVENRIVEPPPQVTTLVADEYAKDWPPFLVWGTATVRVPADNLLGHENQVVPLPPAFVHANTWYAAESCYKADIGSTAHVIEALKPNAGPVEILVVTAQHRPPVDPERERKDEEQVQYRRRGFTLIRGGRDD